MTSAARAPRNRGKKVPAPKDTPAIAESLAAIGWPVFPVSIYEDAAGIRSKVPAVKWKDEATTDVDVVRAWWKGEHRGRWIGVYAGKAGIVVLDVDPAKPESVSATGEVFPRKMSGDESIKAAGLEVPPTFSYPTHRKGGRHHVYAAPAGIDLTIAKELLEGVDVRSGAGLMVYYGPALKKVPTLAPAPDWILVERGVNASNGNATDRAPSADEAEFRARLLPGKLEKNLKREIRAVEFPPGAAHDNMTGVVARIVGLGVKGHRGVEAILDETEARYTSAGPDRPRDWDNALTGSIRRQGLPPNPHTFTLTKAERAELAERGKPEAIMQRKREHVAKKIRGTTETAVDDLSDDALADRFAAEVRGTWAHDVGIGLLRYDGLVWRPVDDALLVERCRKFVRGIRREMTAYAIERGGDKTLEADAKRLGSKTAISAIAKLTAGILLDETPDLDRDPDVLNVLNGVVDLRTGELRERRYDDYFTKIAGAEYHPGLRSEDWEKALEAVPKKVRPWLKVRLGQAATGRISRDKSVPFLIGGGDNGKSAVLGGCRSSLGSYAVTVPERLLLGADTDHPTELMTLRGARMAVFEELPRGGRLNAQRMKLLAGTNELTGRKMHHDFVTWKTTHTLVGSSNHLPVISDVDDAIWERVAPVNFPYKFVGHKPRKGTKQRRGDEGLRDRLAESPSDAALTWLIEGAVESYRAMPPKPRAVVDALAEWRGDADPVLGFVRDKLILDPHLVVAASDLYAEFGRYLEARGQTRWSDNLMAVSFSGHSSLEGVRKRQLRLGPTTHLSRPTFAIAPVPARVMSWLGVGFRGDDRPPTPEELDARTLADLDRGLS